MLLWQRLFGKKRQVRGVPRQDKSLNSNSFLTNNSKCSAGSALNPEIADPLDLIALKHRINRLKTMTPIESYERMLAHQPLENASLRAHLQMDLGNLYCQLLTGDRAKNLRRAIEYYEKALKFYNPQTTPTEYAGIQNNLGNAYLLLQTGNRSDNLQRSIAFYEEALRFLRPDAAPLDYARAQNNLGAAYMELPTGIKSNNLQRAIACFQDALRFRTAETVPLDYSATTDNLGTAYLYLPTGDRSSNLQRAVEHFRTALRFRTPEAAPLDYAMSKDKLGVTYLYLPTGDLSWNLQQAIECFNEAFRFRKPEAAPIEYATTQNNMGLAYCKITVGDRSKNLHAAIDCFKEALRFRTADAAPNLYAQTLRNLGNAYRELPTGNRDSNLQQAIEYVKNALNIWSPEASPIEYAVAMNNLAANYSELTEGDRDSNLQCAVNYCNEALKFFDVVTNPYDYRSINRNLALLHFARRDRTSALTAFNDAMKAGEVIYRACLSRESKESELAKNAVLYPSAALASALTQGAAKALIVLESGKTRLLAEALRLKMTRPKSVPDDAWSAFETAGVTFRAAYSSGPSEPDDYQYAVEEAYDARRKAIKEANVALEAAVATIRNYDPKFLAEIEIADIQNLLTEKNTVLVAFCVTNQGSMAFLVTGATNAAVKAVPIHEFDSKTLKTLLWGIHDEPASGGWIRAYLESKKCGDPLIFHCEMDRILSELSEKFLRPIISTLPIGTKNLIILPSGEMFLFPFHAAPFPGESSQRICDHYRVSYAPSAEVLAACQAKATGIEGIDIYEVINPEEDQNLLFTSIEGASIAELFTIHLTDKGRDATRERVKNRIGGRYFVHFCCHGVYNWDEPRASGLGLHDGLLTLKDLEDGSIDMTATRLATLSACETGLTDVIKHSAAEYVGLPAGFMLAGVPCVVSSLWGVPDISTAILMENFYYNLIKRKLDIPSALHAAQQWVRTMKSCDVADYIKKCLGLTSSGKENDSLSKIYQHYSVLSNREPSQQPFSHPYYWAAFTVNGA